MAASADSERSGIVVFACSGAAHCGHVANAAGMLLHQEGAGTLLCICAVAATVPDKLEQARRARLRVVIDGCEEKCCQKVLTSAGLPTDLHVLAVDLGVQKEPTEPCLLADTKKVVDHVHELLARAKA